MSDYIAWLADVLESTALFLECMTYEIYFSCWTGYLSLFRFAHLWDTLLNAQNKFHISFNIKIYFFLFIYNLNIKAAAGKVKGINKQTDRQTDK